MTMNIQLINMQLDNITDQFVEDKITEEEANKRIEIVFRENEVPSYMIEALKTRIDKRSYAGFYRDIRNGIPQEHIMLKKWIEGMGNWEFKVKWTPYGTDLKGLSLIVQVNSKPDYLIAINDSPDYRIDVKTCPTDIFNTFKKTDLEHYKRYNAGALVCIGNRGSVPPVLKSFIFYGASAIKLLSNYEGRTFEKFAAGKPAVRVAKKEIMDQTRAHISFEDLIKDKKIDIGIFGETCPVFNGPLQHIISQGKTF